MDTLEGDSHPENEPLKISRYKIRGLFQVTVQCVQGRVGLPSLERANSLAQDLGITSGRLDRKLRHCSGLRRYIIKILQDLVDDVSKLPPRSGARKADGDDVEARLDTTLRSLISLLSTMKDPTPSDDIERLSQAVREDVFTQFDVRRVQDKFPNCDPKLHRRIGALNRVRRLRLQDAQRAFERRVAAAMEKEREAQEGEGGSSGVSKQTLLLDESLTPLSELLQRSGFSGTASETSSVASSSNTSGYRSWAFNEDGGAGVVGNMEPRVVGGDDQQLSIPQIPPHLQVTSKTDPLCPFCMTIVQKGMSQMEWEEHVLDDVEPFMCTFGGCAQSYRTYGSRDDWQDHENSVHRISAVWICHDCDKTFSSAEFFKDHIRSAHHESFPELHLDAIAKMCRTVRTDDAPRRHCILCGVTINTKQDEFDHLTVHLFDLALFVFPRMEEIEEDQNLAPREDDSYSEIFEESPTIQGLDWFKEFGKDDVIPFERVGILGRGTFSNVEERKCTIGPTAGTLYACKSILIPKISRRRDDIRRQAKAEVTHLRRLRHVHIVSISGAYIQKNTFTLVLYPVFDSDLHVYLELVHEGGAEKVRKKWFGCLASALAYLHLMRIRHKDIKPYNIGIKSGGIFLAGFSISADYTDADSDSEGPVVMTPRYAPPEVLEHKLRGSLSDVFSLGCVFFEMLLTFNTNESIKNDLETMEAEFLRYGGENLETYQEIITRFKDVPLDVQPALQICSKMMSREKRSRPKAQQVLDLLVEASQGLGTLHTPGSSLVGKCVLTPRNLDEGVSDAVSVRTLRVLHQRE